MANNNNKPDIVNADFLSFLKEINKGKVALDASLALESIVAAVKETGCKGGLIIKINIDPAGNTKHGEVDQVYIKAQIVQKKPEPAAKPALFFTTRNNTLTRHDPNQEDWITNEEKKQKSETTK